MPRRTLLELGDDLKAAELQIPVGAEYTHFKHPEVAYTITGFAILEATEEVSVLYRTPDGVTFARPLSDFLAIVEYECAPTPRFTRIT